MLKSPSISKKSKEIRDHENKKTFTGPNLCLTVNCKTFIWTDLCLPVIDSLPNDEI